MFPGGATSGCKETMSSGVPGRRFAWLVLATCAAGSGCGGFVASDSNVARRTLDERGGVLAFRVFSIEVPPTALNHVTTLSVRRSPVEAPDGPAFVVEPAGLTFNDARPVTIAIDYDPSTFEQASEIFAAILDSAEWHLLPRPEGDLLDAGPSRGLSGATGTFGLIACPGGVCAAPTLDAGALH